MKLFLRLADIVRYWEATDVVLRAYIVEPEEHVYVSLLRVPIEIRRRGYGTEVLKDVTDFADNLGFQVRLHSSAIEDNTTQDVLRAFYLKAGFVEVKPQEWVYGVESIN